MFSVQMYFERNLIRQKAETSFFLIKKFLLVFQLNLVRKVIFSYLPINVVLTTQSLDH